MDKLNKITFVLIRSCNLNCKYCFSKKENEYLDFKKIASFISKIPSDYKNDINITLTGGEPFLYPNILELLNKIGEERIECNILTNGTILSEELLSIIKKYNMNIFVSLDSINKNTNDYLRGHTNQVLRNIERLKSEGIPVTIECVLSKKNYMELESLLKYINDNKLKICINPISTEIQNFKLKELSKSELKKLFSILMLNKKLFTKRNLYYIYAYLKDINIQQYTRTCRFAHNNIVVDSNGAIYRCFYNNKKIGEIDEIKNIIDFMNSMNDVSTECFTEACIGVLN